MFSKWDLNTFMLTANGSGFNECNAKPYLFHLCCFSVCAEAVQALQKQTNKRCWVHLIDFLCPLCTLHIKNFYKNEYTWRTRTAHEVVGSFSAKQGRIILAPVRIEGTGQTLTLRMNITIYGDSAEKNTQFITFFNYENIWLISACDTHL